MRKKNRRRYNARVAVNGLRYNAYLFSGGSIGKSEAVLERYLLLDEERQNVQRSKGRRYEDFHGGGGVSTLDSGRTSRKKKQQMQIFLAGQNGIHGIIDNAIISRRKCSVENGGGMTRQ